MKKYDVIVIGSGSGMSIVEEALVHNMSVALVDKGPVGGTCLNLGCIPSKMLIYPADVVAEIQEAGKLGIQARVENVDFNAIMERMRKSTAEDRERMRHGFSHVKKLGFYEGIGRFVADYTVEVNGEQIKADKVFIAAGSRTLVPPIKGLDNTPYLTNESLLQLTEKPESLIIIGGGYIAAEYGHFFAAMGTRVTMLEMADRLVLAEEPDIADLLKKELSRRMGVFTGVQAQEVKANNGAVGVIVKDMKDGSQKEFTAQSLLVAVGRRSNADLLNLENTGVELNARGFIKTNEYLETSKNNIWAVGDVNGEQMFTHAANREAMTAADNAIHDSKTKMDYSATPHAVYSHPQIASVGLTEASAIKNHKILVGRANYSDVAYGQAMMEENGFAKAIVDAESKKILGFHVIGPYAPIVIQEVINIMAAGGNINHLNAGMHIHPALPELILRTFSNLEEAKPAPIPRSLSRAAA